MSATPTPSEADLLERLWPQPKRREARAGSFALGRVLRLRVDEPARAGASRLARRLAAHGIPAEIVDGATGADVRVRIAERTGDDPDAYRLDVDPTGIDIAAAGARGAWNALQTLEQIVHGSARAESGAASR